MTDPGCLLITEIRKQLMETAVLYRLKSFRSLSIHLLHKTAPMTETLRICLPSKRNFHKE